MVLWTGWGCSMDSDQQWERYPGTLVGCESENKIIHKTVASERPTSDKPSLDCHNSVPFPCFSPPPPTRSRAEPRDRSPPPTKTENPWSQWPPTRCSGMRKSPFQVHSFQKLLSNGGTSKLSALPWAIPGPSTSPHLRSHQETALLVALRQRLTFSASSALI